MFHSGYKMYTHFYIPFYVDKDQQCFHLRRPNFEVKCPPSYVLFSGHWSASDPGLSEGEGARNMKYNAPRMAVIFFNREGGAWLPPPPGSAAATGTPILDFWSSTSTTNVILPDNRSGERCGKFAG